MLCPLGKNTQSPLAIFPQSICPQRRPFVVRMSLALQRRPIDIPLDACHTTFGAKLALTIRHSRQRGTLLLCFSILMSCLVQLAKADCYCEGCGCKGGP